MKNLATSKEYQGYNHEVLQKALKERGYTSHEWMTYLQARQNGYHVKKGSKGVPIKFFSDEEEKHQKEEARRRAVRWTHLFNLEDCEKNQ